jgi:hypothetical protein
VLGVVLAGAPLLGAGRAAPAVVPLAGLSLVFVAISLAGVRLLAFVLVTLAAEFMAREMIVGFGASAAVGFGVGLLLLCELVAWAETLRPPAVVERAIVVRRALRLCGLVVVAALSSTLVLLGASISSPDAFVAGVAGAIAAVTLIALARSLSA